MLSIGAARRGERMGKTVVNLGETLTMRLKLSDLLPECSRFAISEIYYAKVSTGMKNMKMVCICLELAW